MATLQASFLQLVDTAPGVVLNASWIQLQAVPIVAAPANVAAVTGDATNDTAGTVTWVSVSGDESGFEVQLEVPAGSGNWVAATGDANPTGAGATSFAFTGQASGALLTPRVRGFNGVGFSNWVQGAQFALDNLGGGGAVIPGAMVMNASWLQLDDSATAPAPSEVTAVVAAVERLRDRASIVAQFSQTHFAEIVARESTKDRVRIVASVASSRVSGGMLASLAAEFTLSRSQVGLFIDYVQVLDCAIRATRFYAGWARLDDPSSNLGVFTITGATTVQPDEWATIFPLFVLYVERETAVAIESSRVAGVDAVGRDSASVEGDIRQLEAELPQKAYVEPAWSVGFPSTIP